MKSLKNLFMHEKKRSHGFFAFLPAVMLAFAICLSGCGLPDHLFGIGNKSDADVQTYYAYYISVKDDSLLEERLDLEKDDQEALLQKLQNVVTKQTEGKDAKKKEALLPSNVKIEDIQIDDGELSVSLSKEYAAMEKSREIMARVGMVKTFSQMPGVDSVQFLVNGSPLKNSDGEEVGPLKPGSFVQSAGEDINSYQSEYATLYFADETGTALVREGRKIYYNSNSSLEKAIVSELITGPEDSSHYPIAVPETKLISVLRQDDICYVNLASNSGTVTSINAKENIQIYAIVNTLAENCKVKQVQFSIDGNTNGTYAGSMSLNHLYEKDFSLVAER